MQSRAVCLGFRWEVEFKAWDKLPKVFFVWSHPCKQQRLQQRSKTRGIRVP